jgi:hypothetical protein
MKRAMAATVALFTAGTAMAQSPSPAELLERAHARVRESIGQLSKYTCTQTVDRSYFRIVGRPGRSCDDVVSNKRLGRTRLELVATDRLRLDVAASDDGAEIYSWPNAGRIGSANIEDMAAGGMIGTGPFAAFLIGVFETSGAELIFDHEEKIEGQKLLRYRFHIPLTASHYQVRAGASYSRVSYDGRVWLDPVTADLRRLEVRTGELRAETGSCEATTTVEFARARIGAGEYLLPRRSTLHNIGRYGTESENATTYAACREYHGDSVIHFDVAEPAAAESEVAAPKTPVVPLPPGLPVMLALETPIDTDTAAAGDAITARLVNAVVEMPSKRVLAPAGTTIQGRITHMEHHLDRGDYFLVTLTWEKLERGGASAPFAAILDHPARMLAPNEAGPCATNVQQVEARGGLKGGGTLVLPSHRGRHTTPRGCQSDWLTIEPPR